MVSTRRTASSLSTQAVAAAAGNAADDGTTGAESRLTPTPAEKKTATSSRAAAGASKSKKSNANAAAAAASSSPSRRRVGTALKPVPEEGQTGEEARVADHPASSPQRKRAQGRGKKQEGKANAKSKSKAAAAGVAATSDSSSDDDEDGADDDGLACLAQGMLDALCGLPGGQEKKHLEGEGSESESESDEEDDAAAALPPPATPTSVAAAAAADDGASSESDSDSEDSDDDDEGRAAPVNVSWAPTSLHLPRPATATPAIELLAQRAKRAEEGAAAAAAAAAASCRALPRLSRKKGKEETVTSSSSAAAVPAAPRRASSSWFDLPTQTLTPELKTDLRLLRLRGAMDPTRHYKSADTTKLPSRFHVGTVVESNTDFYSSRLLKSERGQTLTHELLKDGALSAQRKRRFGALQEAAAARGKRGGGGGKGAKVRKTTMPRLKKHRVRPKH